MEAQHTINFLKNTYNEKYTNIYTTSNSATNASANNNYRYNFYHANRAGVIPYAFDNR